MKNKFNAVLIIVLVALLGGLGFFGYKILFTKDAVIVPDFSGKSEDEVRTWCNSLENDPCTITTDYSDTVEKGYVVYQSISADEELGDSIRFIISLGSQPKIDIPALDKNTTKESIETWATSIGLTNVSYIDETSETVEKGTVIRIEPQVIETLDTEVKVFISSGKKEPDSINVESGKYVNLTVSEFEAKVKALGLKAVHAESKDEKSNTVKKGNIVWHGSGEYVKDEEIRYGLCLGENKDVIKVTKGTMVGLTLDEFKTKIAALGKKGLKAKHVEDYDDYSSTIAKDLIVWHGSGEYDEEEEISYGICKGVNKDAIIVTYGTWINSSVEKITNDAKELNLVVNHKEEKDDYSDDIAKGNILWHGSGTYEKDEKINYGLSLGKKGGTETTDIEVKQGTYIGKSLDDFTKAVKELGLVPKHRSEWDVTDSSKSANTICRNGYGTYVKGENISYGLYVGGSEVTTDTVEIKKGQFVGKSLEEFKKAVEDLGLVPEHSEVYDDDYSETIEKGCVDWHGSGTGSNAYKKGEIIHYTLSLGKEEKISVAEGYVGKTTAEFEAYIKGLGLTPKATGSDYSETIASGLVLNYTAGSYSKNATVTYVTSSGSNPNVYVASGLENKTVTDFTAAVPSSLVLEHDTSLDEYSTIAQGLVVKYTSGTYQKGDKLKYGLSLGAAPVYLNTKDYYNNLHGVNCHSFDEMKAKMQSELSGFTNVSYEACSSWDRDPGMIEKINVAGSDAYEPGTIDAGTQIIVYIVNAKQAQ